MVSRGWLSRVIPNDCAKGFDDPRRVDDDRIATPRFHKWRISSPVQIGIVMVTSVGGLCNFKGRPARGLFSFGVDKTLALGPVVNIIGNSWWRRLLLQNTATVYDFHGVES